MTARRLRRWLGVLVLAVAALVALRQAGSALAESRRLWKRSHRYRLESVEAAQDRLFGREYMASIREIRRRVPDGASLLFVDRQRADKGSTYFALHYLAPRRVVLLDVTRRHALAPLRGARGNRRWVVEVGDFGQPLALHRGRDFARSLRRAR